MNQPPTSSNPSPQSDSLNLDSSKPDKSKPSELLDPALLRLLRCPQTGQTVHFASPALIDETNQSITAGTCRDSTGDLISETIQGGLVSECGTWLYPIRDAIPTMIAEESIRLEVSHK